MGFSRRVPQQKFISFGSELGLYLTENSIENMRILPKILTGGGERAFFRENESSKKLSFFKGRPLKTKLSLLKSVPYFFPFFP
jgi:hypothetical protein